MDRSRPSLVVVTHPPLRLERLAAPGVGAAFAIWVLWSALHAPLPPWPSSPRQFLEILFGSVWVGAWLFFGSFESVALLWAIFGREELALRPQVIMYKRRIGPLAWTRSFAREDIQDVWFDPEYAEPARLMADRSKWFAAALTSWGLSGGPLQFRHQGKTIGCCAGMERQEALSFMQALKAPALLE